MAETPLHFPPASRARLEPHLPPSSPPSDPNTPLPFITLTFATSLDSALSLGPGIRTALSGPESKAMTHYLRTRHDAICIGVGTAIADDPGLNSRLSLSPPPSSPPLSSPPLSSPSSELESNTLDSATPLENQPRPIIIDPHLRWPLTASTKVLRLAREGRGRAPYIVTLASSTNTPAAREKLALLASLGGKFIVLPDTTTGQSEPRSEGEKRENGEKGEKGKFAWHDIFAAVRREGLRSIMVEGGGGVINSLLARENQGLVDSVIVTIAPTWLGRGGVVVSPSRAKEEGGAAVARLARPVWIPLGEDVVLCGGIER